MRITITKFDHEDQILGRDKFIFENIKKLEHKIKKSLFSKSCKRCSVEFRSDGLYGMRDYCIQDNILYNVKGFHGEILEPFTVEIPKLAKLY